MAGGDSLNAALASLLARRSDPASRVLVAPPCVEGVEDAAPRVELGELPVELRSGRELTRALREGGWAVVVLDRITGPMLRALQGAPPGLLVCTGDVDEETEEALASARVPLLGPFAELACHPEGEHLLCGVDRAELRGLRRVFPEARIALAPTPSWLPAWLDDPLLEGHDAVGTVVAAQLDASWTALAEQPRAWRDLLIPVGVPALELDAEAFGAAWDQVLAAHALERYTGPVFPSPRVIRALHGAGASQPTGSDRRAEELAQARRAMWDQARRALAREASADGIEAPADDIDLTTPASALLAQGPHLRRERARRLVDEGALPLPPLDEELEARALEVLRASPEWLSEHEAKVVLRGFGFEITRQAVANSASGAANYGDRIGFPVVLKALSPSLRRRHEMGAVKLDLPNAASVRRAYAEVVANVERHAPTARLDGVVVAEMIEPGFELRCGLRRLASGAFAVFAQAAGPGATREPVTCAHPFREADALCAAELVLSRLPVHARRRAADPDPHTVAQVLLGLQRMADRLGDRLVSVDLTPLRLLAQDPRAAVVLDASIRQLPHLEGL